MKNPLSLRHTVYSAFGLFPSRCLCNSFAWSTFALARGRGTGYSTNAKTKGDGPEGATSDDKEGTLNQSRTKEPRTETSTDSVYEALFVENPDTTMIFGPPDRMSNLRPKRYRPLDEKTALSEDVAWKTAREEVDKFNEDFWTANNAKFQEAKYEYVKEVYTSKKKVTPEDLSVFYKRFLDESYERHMVYNRMWYGKNFEMLLFSWKSFWRRCFSQERRKPE